MVELAPDVVVAGKLRLLRPLGHGGMGVVWVARHLALDTDVAVKLIRPERAAADPALVARFEREAKATARIAHPNVVQVMDYGTVEGIVPYIVMELLTGFSLAELLERGGRLSLGTTKLLVRQVGSALEAAHAHGVIHRDLKPHNLFICEHRDAPIFVKMLDFGVAKMLGDTQVPGANAALTETGVVIGTPAYMSPEQIEGSRNVDLRSDLWSLGVIVYEALTGSLPFSGSSFVTVGSAVLKGRYQPASDLRPNLPPSIDDWFAKALCVDPDGRFQSAGEMVDALVRQEEPAPSSRLLEREHSIAAFATTIAAPVIAGTTAPHAPAAEQRRPEPAPVPAAPRRKRSLVLVAVGACAAIAGGVALARTATTAGCPAGMVLVEGARFAMGSAADAETPSDETPRHEATVASFCLDVTEVTVGAYAACESCVRATQTVEFEGLTPNGRQFESQFCNGPDARDHPINCVDHAQATAYCAAQDKRLPTEAEWELAARGKDGRTYPWGHAAPSGDRLNACGAECSRMLTSARERVGKGAWPAMYPGDDSAEATAPVGRHPAGASPAGVLDLAGNVWEWTETPYCPYESPDCGDSRRVLRGGGWDTTESQDVRSARRYPSARTARGRSIGFRCAKTP